MPVFEQCGYVPPFIFPGGHAQTIGPRVVRPVPQVPYVRERLELPDGDFLLLDWFSGGKNMSDVSRVAILLHGLEGDATRSYIRAMGRCLRRAGWDILACNARGCGGEMNRLPRMYHCGETDDLHAVIAHCLSKGYSRLALLGFSMGGNQILKYLGENPARVPQEVAAAVAVSTPCDLTGSSVELGKKKNRLYMEYFMRTLKQKIRLKHERFPALFDVRGLDAMKTFAEFDNAYTAPVHGFNGAADYWKKASSLQFLKNIAVPALLVNAKNDPFLSPGCFPVQEARENNALFLLTPEQGGHVGFPSWPWEKASWLEKTAASFLRSVGNEGALGALLTGKTL